MSSSRLSSRRDPRKVRSPADVLDAWQTWMSVGDRKQTIQRHGSVTVVFRGPSDGAQPGSRATFRAQVHN